MRGAACNVEKVIRAVSILPALILQVRFEIAIELVCRRKGGTCNREQISTGNFVVGG